MSLKIIKLKSAQLGTARAKVMIIYTGGTFGMVRDADEVLVPLDFSLILEHLPTLRNLFLDLTVISFEQPIDSSDINPHHWQQIGGIIFEHYRDQDGFVILHGTDTMAYTASALSFMFSNLQKPVVLTGAQLPISDPRSDARENLITSLEIAAAKQNGRSIVPEVCIYFDYELLRGNRTRKVESMSFDAFKSENYPALASAGVKINYNHAAIMKVSAVGELELRTKFDSNLSILKLFPGINEKTIQSIFGTPGIKGVVLETYGSGNAPSNDLFLSAVIKAVENGLIVLNISQCPGGMVTQGKYQSSKKLEEIGVISGFDMTTESAVTKLMFLLGEYGVEEVKEMIQSPFAGEFTVQ